MLLAGGICSAHLGEVGGAGALELVLGFGGVGGEGVAVFWAAGRGVCAFGGGAGRGCVGGF